MVEALLPRKCFYLIFLGFPHIFSCRLSAIDCYSRSREAASRVCSCSHSRLQQPVISTARVTRREKLLKGVKSMSATARKFDHNANKEIIGRRGLGMGTGSREHVRRKYRVQTEANSTISMPSSSIICVRNCPKVCFSLFVVIVRRDRSSQAFVDPPLSPAGGETKAKANP
jgi:hypothetical protein